ncbi:helix-turn-helix domain-containing protein [Lacibacterium aquatile]|uniref:Helix-turn-helix domain-containing protein n=1 Tax=Lacibacterium aquatile TaxID=1168082 RepID=A0ABW5E040_9PROT
MNDGRGAPEGRPANLGQVIRKARMDLQLSQRQVEEKTGKEVSNAYLSQLESGKISKPSPQILYALAGALEVSYEGLMERAGYVAPSSQRADENKHGRAATFAVENLTAEEENALLDYLAYLRSKKV